MGRVCSYETLQFEDYDKMVFEIPGPGGRGTGRSFPKIVKRHSNSGKGLHHRTSPATGSEFLFFPLPVKIRAGKYLYQKNSLEL